MMRCLTYAECADWCRQHNYPVIDSNTYGRPAPMVRREFAEVRLAPFVDVGDRVSLARQLIEWMSTQGEILLWLTDWGVWSRVEHVPLFGRLRQAVGEHRPLIEAPGHIITPSQLDDGVAVLVLALWFLWDCSVFSERRGPVFVCSHDEWTSFFVPPESDPRPLLTEFGLLVAGSGSETTEH